MGSLGVSKRASVIPSRSRVRGARLGCGCATTSPRGRPVSPRQRGLLLPGQVPDLGRRGLLGLLLVCCGLHGGAIRGPGPDRLGPSLAAKACTATSSDVTPIPWLSEFARKRNSREIQPLASAFLCPASSPLLWRRLPGYREAPAAGLPLAPPFPPAPRSPVLRGFRAPEERGRRGEATAAAASQRCKYSLRAKPIPAIPEVHLSFKGTESRLR